MTVARMLRTPPRRRREKLTDYRYRLKIIKSSIPRLVVRRTNRAIIAQIIQPKIGGDRCVTTVTSKMLSRYGWKGSPKNIPAAYLTGLLVGCLAKKAGVGEAVMDLGLHRPVAGSRLFAVVKGARDAGLSVPFSENVAPSEERLRGDHIKTYFEMVGGRPGVVQFSRCDPSGYAAMEIMIEEVKARILGGAGR
ncbi:MAG: 50S ribosomal protein L18 [Nitrososphaerota archaeon]